MAAKTSQGNKARANINPINTPTPSWGQGGLDPNYLANLQKQWMQVFQETHGGLTPDQYNAQFAANQANQQIGTANAPAAIQQPDSSNLTPTIMPFLTAQDLMTLNSFDLGNAQTLAQIDSALAQQSTDTAFQKNQLDTSAKQNTAQTQDQMAARGIFQSSIKDGALYDIAAQKTIRQNLLDDQMSNAQLSAQRQKQNIQDAIGRMQQAMNLQAIQNAKDASQGSPNTYTPPPDVAAPTGLAALAPYANDPAVVAYLQQKYAEQQAAQAPANTSYVGNFGIGAPATAVAGHYTSSAQPHGTVAAAVVPHRPVRQGWG